MIEMENIRCPLCGRDNTTLIFKRQDLTFCVSKEEFCVVRCRHCDLVYVNPRPTESEIHKYYPEEFYQTHLGAEQLLREKDRQLQLKYEYVKEISPGKLLDVGCSKGEFMFYMQKKGWEVHGIDFSDMPPNVFGLDIFYGPLEAARYPPDSFDLVTLWAVLEHAYHPLEMLTHLGHLLKPGGKMVSLVTNFNSIPARFMRHDDIPRHTTLFTKRTLRKMLRRAGFSIEGFYFNCELFGGTNRGLFNYLIKLVSGEKIEVITAQNRSAVRWQEFSSQLRGRPSSLMLMVDKIDIAIYPRLDRWLDNLQFGFIMIVKTTKECN